MNEDKVTDLVAKFLNHNNISVDSKIKKAERSVLPPRQPNVTGKAKDMLPWPWSPTK